jgi:predicted acyltransferase
VALGLAFAAGGWLWSYWLPLNRHLWTSSMILWAGGLSFLLLALFYAVIDFAGIRCWTFPFVVIGANALLAYVLDALVDPLSSTAVKAAVSPDWPTSHVQLYSAFLELAALWLICWLLYRRRLFLRA